VHEHEIADGGGDAQAEGLEFRRQPAQPLLVVGSGALDMGAVSERGNAGLDRHCVDVEGSAHAVDGLDDVRRREHPAYAQSRQPVDLGECAGHDDVLEAGDQLDAGLVVVAAHIFGIGGVEHQQHAFRESRMQPADFLERQVGAGRVVRIGQEHDPRPAGDGGEDCIDIGALVRFRHRDRQGAGGLDVDPVDQETVRGEDRLVAGRQIGLGKQADELVRAVRADDVGSVQPMRVGDGLPEPRGGAVGIEFEPRSRLARRLDRPWRGAERILVRRQLVHLGDTVGRRAPAGNVSLDLHDAGTRLRACRFECVRHAGIIRGAEGSGASRSGNTVGNGDCRGPLTACPAGLRSCRSPW